MAGENFRRILIGTLWRSWTKNQPFVALRLEVYTLRIK